MPKIYSWLRHIQAMAIGPRCSLCLAPSALERALCGACQAELPWLGHACRHCAEALPDDADTPVCAACAQRPRFDAALAAFAYEEPVRWLVTELKFRGRLVYAPLLADLLAERIDRGKLPERLVPVPLHPRTRRRRGFNQAERIAARLGRRLDIPLAAGSIERVRATSAQSGLSASKRAANVRGAFASRTRLPGAHVAIVDDVVTTTHTAAAVAACLRRAGATRIDLYCVARA